MDYDVHCSTNIVGGAVSAGNPLVANRIRFFRNESYGETEGQVPAQLHPHFEDKL